MVIYPCFSRNNADMLTLAVVDVNASLLTLTRVSQLSGLKVA